MASMPVLLIIFTEPVAGLCLKESMFGFAHAARSTIHSKTVKKKQPVRMLHISLIKDTI